MWWLIIMAVNVSDPQDIPGWAQVPFHTETECIDAKSKSTTWIKFNKSYRIDMRCEKK